MSPHEEKREATANRKFRAIQPTPNPEHHDPKAQKRVRKHYQACNECRKLRVKCDGVRPCCGSCGSRNRACTYIGSEGETRLTATKKRLHLLENVIETLQSSTPTQAAQLLQDLRSKEDLNALLDRAAIDASTQGVVSGTPNQGADAFRDVHVHNGKSVQPSSHSTHTEELSSPIANFHRSSNSVGSLTEPASSRQGSSSREGGSPLNPGPPGVFQVILPSAEEVARATRGFFKCSGRLFHVFTEMQVAEFHDTVYGGSNSSKAACSDSICCLMSVAAVGAQYEHGTYELETEAAFYDIARHYFDSIVQRESLDAIKVCALLALYNILAKAAVALSYAEIGLSLSRRLKFVNDAKGEAGIPATSFIESKHAWRTLTFMSSWLSCTLGYVSGNDDMPYDHLPFGRPSDSSDLLEIVQNEMTNVVILKCKILRMHLAFRELTMLSVRSILEDVQTWYGRIPPQLKLDSEQHQAIDPLTKWSIYHVHLLYLDANILLYRRMLAQHVESWHTTVISDGTSPTLKKLFSDQGEQAILAAKGSVRILALLLQERGIFKRCWLVIFQSYTSCLVILHSAMQKLLHKWDLSKLYDDLEKARLCLTVLDYCRGADETAQRFYEDMKDVYDYILSRMAGNPTAKQTQRFPAIIDEGGLLRQQTFRIDIGSFLEDSIYLINIPDNADATHTDRSCQLVVKLCQPFGDPKHQGLDISDVKKRWRDEPTRGLHTLMLAKLDWDLESRQPFRLGLGRSVGPADATYCPGSIGDTSESAGTNSGRFIGSTAPSGWLPAVSLGHLSDREGFMPQYKY